jgi:hypothetical protein
MLDGYGQGVSRGTDYCKIYNNRIDVGYTVAAQSGPYVENHVAGLYDRYSSGNNSFEDNIIIVDNEVGGTTEGAFVGSDSADRLMTNLVYDGNTIINHDHGSDTAAFRFAVADQVIIRNTRYLADRLWVGNWDYQNRGGITDLQMTNNNAIQPAAYTPSVPTGLTITRFFDSYLITWDDHLDKGEEQTYEYIVYRDGQRLNMSPRGGTFFVDIGVSGVHTYAVSAINLSGIEGGVSGSVSTANARNGWSTSGSNPPPEVPSNLRVVR